MPEVAVRVETPRFWWRAIKKHLHLVDPDVTDGKARHTSYGQNWFQIAQAASQIGWHLAEGQYELSGDDRGVVYIHDFGLTREELAILTSWFDPLEPVRRDPWERDVFSGRHRIWHAAQAAPDTPLPILGTSLPHTNPAGAREAGDGLWHMSRANASKLAALTWFDPTDALNARFVEATCQAAAGTFPRPA